MAETSSGSRLWNEGLEVIRQNQKLKMLLIYTQIILDV